MTKVKNKSKDKAPIAKAVKMLPVADLHISRLNMRHGKTPPDIDDIYPSVLKSGINQSLLVRKEGKGWGVIAGRRRLFALKKKAKETGQTQKAPCVVMESGDVKAAREASLLENIARLPATQLEQFAAFKALSDSGKDASEIADTFAISEKSVRRVLALANLLPELLDLFEAEDIGKSTIQALTLATRDQQEKWLALYHSDDYAPLGHNLKEWLTGGAPIETDAALFDMSTFDGHIITDLFGETEYFADPDQFWPLQNTAIAEAVEAWKAEGWTDVIVLERGDYFDRCEHGQRSLEQGGKVYVQVAHSGQITPFIGYLPKSDIRKIEAILGKDNNNDNQAKTATPKPEMSGPLTEYVNLHRHSAIRATLLDYPKVALRLSVAHMLVGSSLWQIAPEKTTSRKEATTDSVATSKGAVRFEAEREAIYALLDITQFDSPYSPNKRLADGDVTDLFAKMMQMDDDVVLRIMTFAMAESLEAGRIISEAMTYAVPVDMADMWKPDDAFFDILRDKRVINAMVADIAGETTAKSALTETGVKQKQIIRNRIGGHGAEPRPDWRPKWMQVPPTSYLEGESCDLVSAAERAEKAMVEDEPQSLGQAA